MSYNRRDFLSQLFTIISLSPLAAACKTESILTTTTPNPDCSTTTDDILGPFYRN